MRRAVLIIAILSLVGVLCAAASFAATNATVNITATVAPGTNSVSITQASLGFGNVTPAQTAHRFSGGPMTVTYFAANSPWTIRAYTNNHPGAETPPATDGDFAGLKGADNTSYVPLKIWNANFGGGGIGSGTRIVAADETWTSGVYGYSLVTIQSGVTLTTSGTVSVAGPIVGPGTLTINGKLTVPSVSVGHVNVGAGGTLVIGPPPIYPDPEIDLNWIGTPPDYNDVKWGRIPEKDEQTLNPFTWRILAKTGGELPSPFANYLAFDAQGAKPQAYSTTLTVEIINQ